MADLELEARSASWLRSRRFGDRRRLLEPRTRARALLSLGADAIRVARDGAAPQLPRGARAQDPWAERERLASLLLGELADDRAEELGLPHLVAVRSAAEHVERIAAGGACHELVDGVAYLLPAVKGLDDPRLRAIAAAAALLGVSESTLDDATARVARRENAAAAIADRYLARLGAPATVTSVRSFSRAASTSAPATAPRLNYDTSRLIEIVAQLPEDVSRSDQLRLGEQLLGNLDDDRSCEGEGPEAPRLAPEVLLLAAEDLAGDLEDALRLMLAEKARLLSTEQPNATGRERDYLIRAEEIDAELAQPIRAQLGYVRRLLVGLAHRVEQFVRWPGSREQPKHQRARALAGQIKLRGRFSEDDIALARIALGFGRTDAV